tara:strand:- start:80 stop:376 length:297 start_codon:yes stop_codon:yes gene_type:complete
MATRRAKFIALAEERKRADDADDADGEETEEKRLDREARDRRARARERVERLKAVWAAHPEIKVALQLMSMSFALFHIRFLLVNGTQESLVYNYWTGK